MSNKVMNLWEHDLLKQGKTQINISPISEIKHEIKNVSEINIRRHFHEQSQIILVVSNQGTIAVGLSKIPTGLPLKP